METKQTREEEFFKLKKQHQIPNKKIIIIGDIHGQLKQLKSLMKNLKDYLEDHVLVFLGDYCDRGPQIKETIQYLIDLKNERKPETDLCTTAAKARFCPHSGQ